MEIPSNSTRSFRFKNYTNIEFPFFGKTSNLQNDLDNITNRSTIEITYLGINPCFRVILPLFQILNLLSYFLLSLSRVLENFFSIPSRLTRRTLLFQISENFVFYSRTTSGRRRFELLHRVFLLHELLRIKMPHGEASATNSALNPVRRYCFSCGKGRGWEKNAIQDG